MLRVDDLSSEFDVNYMKFQTPYQSYVQRPSPPSMMAEFIVQVAEVKTDIQARSAE